jgi:hypothetical protein
MSGGQGGGCRFENILTLLMNLERPTTCRYHIPHVVAYVVGYVEGLVVYSELAEASTDPVGAFGIQTGALSSYTVCMKNFVVESGDFIKASGIYRMNDHPGREITLIYGDAVPTFQGGKIKFRLIRAAKNPRRG